MPTISEKQPQTIEQKRAQNAWEKSEKYEQAHINMAKGLPALIMNSGLMQVLAFLHGKGEHHECVGKHLREWLCERFSNSMQLKNSSFVSFMQNLQRANPDDYQILNQEAMAWLKWLRLMSAARNKNK